MRWSNSRATGKLPPREIGSSTDAGANLHICVLTLFPSRLIIKAEEINVFPQRREMSEFGNNLYRLRKLRGWTQQELADQLGVTNRSVSKWETGETLPETGQLIPLDDAFGVTVDELLRGPKAPLAAEHLPAAPAIQLEENTGPFPTESASPAVTSEHTPQTADTSLTKSSDPEKENAHAAQSDELEVYMKERRRRAKKKMTPLIILGAGISSIGLIVGFALLVAGFPELSTPFMFYGTPIGICIFGFAIAWICNYPKLKPGTTTKPLIKFLLALIAGFILSYGGTQLMFAWIEDWIGIIGSIVTGVGIIGIVYALLLWYNETKYCLIQEETQEKLSAGEPTKKKRLNWKLSALILVIAVICYILMGTLGNLWGTGWVIILIAAIACGVFSDLGA